MFSSCKRFNQWLLKLSKADYFISMVNCKSHFGDSTFLLVYGFAQSTHLYFIVHRCIPLLAPSEVVDSMKHLPLQIGHLNSISHFFAISSAILSTALANLRIAFAINLPSLGNVVSLIASAINSPSDF